jgi:hypothetical protein
MFRQVSWLTAPDRAFPVFPVASCGVQHRLQLRDSKGLTPFSLLSSAGQKHLDMYLVKFKTFLAEPGSNVKRNGTGCTQFRLPNSHLRSVNQFEPGPVAAETWFQMENYCWSMLMVLSGQNHR